MGTLATREIDKLVGGSSSPRCPEEAQEAWSGRWIAGWQQDVRCGPMLYFRRNASAGARQVKGNQLMATSIQCWRNGRGFWLGRDKREM